MRRSTVLDRFAALYGLKRRWFGLEPDYFLRKRILRRVGLSRAFMRAL